MFTMQENNIRKVKKRTRRKIDGVSYSDPSLEDVGDTL